MSQLYNLPISYGTPLVLKTHLTLVPGLLVMRSLTGLTLTSKVLFPRWLAHKPSLEAMRP